jgi:hypothetical protein
MNTFDLNTENEASEAAVELRVLSRDGRWLPMSEIAPLPVPAAVELPGDTILQLVRRAKSGPTTLETILDAVRRQWNSAA